MAVIGYNTGFTVANLTDGRSFGLGDRTEDHLGRTYVYVQAAEAISAGMAVGVDEAYQASKLTTTLMGDGYIIGVAQIAFADNDYGFVAIGGANGLVVNVAASCAADTPLYTSATAGVLDDSTSVGVKVDGIVATAANSLTSVAANVDAMLTFPKSATF